MKFVVSLHGVAFGELALAMIIKHLEKFCVYKYILAGLRRSNDTQWKMEDAVLQVSYPRVSDWLLKKYRGITETRNRRVALRSDINLSAEAKL